MALETTTHAKTTSRVSHTQRPTSPTSYSLRRTSTPYLFIAPFGVLFLLFFIAPIFYAIYSSLFRSQRNGLGLGAATVSFNGLGNYVDVFHDPNFFSGVGRVLLYGVVQVPIMLGLALAFALLLDSAAVRLKPFFRLAFFVPFAIPGIIAALLWGYIYDPTLSPIVQVFRSLGLGSPDFLGQGSVLWSIANIGIWTYTGYNMLIIFAALQAIPTEIYESGRIDGCTGWRLAWNIKIPLVAPALVLTGIFSIIGTLQLFNEPVVLGAISNNISNAYTPNIYAYYTAFGLNNYYYAAALSVVLALVIFVFSFGFLRVTQRQSGV